VRGLFNDKNWGARNYPPYSPGDEGSSGGLNTDGASGGMSGCLTGVSSTHAMDLRTSEDNNYRWGGQFPLERQGSAHRYTGGGILLISKATRQKD